MLHCIELFVFLAALLAVTVDACAYTGLEEIVDIFPEISSLANAASSLNDRPELNAFLLAKISHLASSPGTTGTFMRGTMTSV